MAEIKTYTDGDVLYYGYNFNADDLVDKIIDELSKKPLNVFEYKQEWNQPGQQSVKLTLGFYLGGQFSTRFGPGPLGAAAAIPYRAKFSHEAKDKALVASGVGGNVKGNTEQYFAEWGKKTFPDADIREDQWKAFLKDYRDNLPDKYFQMFININEENKKLGNPDWAIVTEAYRIYFGLNGQKIIADLSDDAGWLAQWNVFSERESTLSTGNVATASDSTELTDAENLQVAANASAGVRGTKSQTDSDEEPIDKDKLIEKLQIVEQCALLTVSSTLRDEVYDPVIEAKLRTDSLPHRGRVIPITSKSPELLINKLTLPDKAYDFFELTAERNNMMKAYRVFYNVSMVRQDAAGEIHDHILVPTGRNRDKTKVTKALKANGEWEDVNKHVYLTDVAVTLAGTNPATARNDIKVTMTWKLSSMEWLDRPIQWYGDANADAITGGRTFKISELITHPKFLEQARGGGRFYRRQYHPSYNRVRLNVFNNAANKDPGDSLWNGVLDGEETKKTLEQVGAANLAIDLALVDHTLQRDADKSPITLTIEYRGYLDTLMSMPFMDAMTTHEILDMRQEREKVLEAAVLSRCPTSEMRKIKRVYQDKMLEEIRLARSSIITRLVSRKKIYGVNMSVDNLKELFTFGYVKKPADLMKEVDVSSPSTEALQSNQVDAYRQSVENDIKDKESDVSKIVDNAMSPVAAAQAKQAGQRTINYFFLGDLIEIVSDIMFQDNGSQFDLYQEEFLNLRPRIVTGNFKYLFFQDEDTSEEINLNISAIPISLQWFMQWFQTNIIDKDLTHVPISTFIKMVVEEVLNGLLSEECFGSGELVNKLLVRTSFFTAVEGADGKDVLLEHSIKQKKTYLDIDQLDGPVFKIDKRRETPPTGEVKRYTNYIVVHAVGHNLFSRKLIGNPLANKIPLIQQVKRKASLTSVTRGQVDAPQEANPRPVAQRESFFKTTQNLIQSISFSKTDTKYLREARYANAATNHLTLLGNVYDVDIKMKGMLFFFPGQFIFVDPSIEQTTNAWESRSIANQLGMAGYYLIQEVQHSLKPSGFSITTVKAKWHNSGVLDDFRVSAGSISKIDDLVYAEIAEQCQELVDAAEIITATTGSAADISGLANEQIKHSSDLSQQDPWHAVVSKAGYDVTSIGLDQEEILQNIADKKGSFPLHFSGGLRATPTGLTATIKKNKDGVIQGWEVYDGETLVGFYNTKGTWVVKESYMERIEEEEANSDD